MSEIQDVYPSYVKINNIAVEYLGPFQFRLSRGINPWLTQILVSDDRFDKLSPGSPVVIEIGAASKNSITGNAINLLNWWAVSIEQADKNRRILTLADDRWRKNFRRVTKAYNIFYANGAAQRHTLKGGVTRWDAIEAIEDVIKAFGFEYYPFPIVDKYQKNEVLRDNMGNNLHGGGGFCSASMSEILQPMLESIRCDIVMTPSGKCRIVNRAEPMDPGLESYIKIGGAIGPRNINFQKPRNCIVQFQQQVCNTAEYVESDQKYANPSGDAALLHLENVAPNMDSDLNTTKEHISVFDLASGVVNNRLPHPGGAIDAEEQRQHILKNYMKKRMYIPRPDDAEQNIRFAVGEDVVRSCWRMRFRFTSAYHDHANPAKLGDAADTYGISTRPYCNIRFGKLAKDGTTYSDGAAKMDYTRQYLFPITLTKGGRKLNPLEKELSINYHATQAPLTPQWVGSGEELVFHLVPGNSPAWKIIPGLLAENIRYAASVKDSVDDVVFILTPTEPEIKSRFDLTLDWAGLLISDVGKTKRMHDVKVKMFDDDEAGIDAVYVRVDDMYANWDNSDSSNSKGFPGVLLNGSLLKNRAKQVANLIKQTYDQSRSGVITCGGIDCLRAGYHTGGEIYDTAIQVGDGQAFAITTHYIIQPEIREVDPNFSNNKGITPNKIG